MGEELNGKTEESGLDGFEQILHRHMVNQLENH